MNSPSASQDWMNLLQFYIPILHWYIYNQTAFTTANFLQGKKTTLAGAGSERSRNALPSRGLLYESIGGTGTKGRKAHAYVRAHKHKCVLEVTWKKNMKPAWKIIRRDKIQGQHFLPKLRKYQCWCRLLVLNSRNSGWSKQPMISVAPFHGAGECEHEANEWQPLPGNTAALPNGNADWSFITIFLFWEKSVLGKIEGKTAETNPKVEIFWGKNNNLLNSSFLHTSWYFSTTLTVSGGE